jgi:uncharacterized YceG family protein
VFARNRSQTAHERTAEERQRDREQRERRRQGLPPLPDTPAREPSVEDPPTVEIESAPPLVAKDLSASIEVPPAPLEEVAAQIEESAAPMKEPPIPIEPIAEPPPPIPIEPIAEPPPPVERERAKTSRRSARMSKGVERLRSGRANSHRWYRRLPARLGALLALAAVGGAIWLLAQSLGGSSSHKTSVAPRVMTVTIPEGYTRAHIAALAKDEGLKGDYLAATVRSSRLHSTHYGAPHGTPNLEGFLFPATYDVYAGAPVSRLVNEQLAAFRENFGNTEIHRAHSLGVTPYQLLIVASMIEREAEVQRDRPLIAAVIYNRLHQGIPLGIDATIRYALNDFSAPLTEAQLRDPSPYNTRLHHGLPPTPIANPGLASIHAAAHPAHVSYLYYVAGADGCGEHVFSSSYAQFEHDAAAYREAVAKNHGRVPTCKKR